ncbi:MAG: 50S ribosomal protein L15, partial [Nitrososphaerota archaeon]
MGTRHRKSRKRRGSRTCGWGQIGQHRKSGSRGGHGHAGMHKHKWTWVLKHDPDYFGK